MEINKLFKNSIFIILILLSASIFNGCEAENLNENKGVKDQDSLNIAGNSGVGIGHDKKDENTDDNTDDNTDTDNSDDIVVVSQKGWYTRVVCGARRSRNYPGH